MHIDPLLLPLTAVLLLVLPMPWLFAAFTAAMLHELSHIFMVRILGGRITGISIGIGAAIIQTHIPGTGRELICALAGPLGSILLLFVGRYFPRLALCALVQGLFNLLPIYPMDGGRILWCVTALIHPEGASGICNVIADITILLMILFGICGLVQFSFGPLPLLIALHFLWNRKKTCKQS